MMNKNQYEQLKAENKERLKELSCINTTTQILKQGKSIEESLQQITLILPKAWQYPEHTVARIRYAENEFRSPGFRETSWIQSRTFETIDGEKGMIEIYYTREFETIDEGPFLKEERDLIDNLGNIITGFINGEKACDVFEKQKKVPDLPRRLPIEKTKPISSRQLLQKFLKKQNADRDIFHDLMPFKVKEILLIANLYDAYSIEGEGRFSDHILGEYHQLSLTSMPRLTGVSNEYEAFEQLESKHFDLIIVMMGMDKNTPLEISRKIKHAYKYIPIFLLLNNNKDIASLEEKKEELVTIDKVFVWNGDPKVFFAMVKLLEDKVNVENDCKIGLTRIILLVEDSSKYYSRYLPMIYSIVLEQTKHLIEDVSTDELYKILKLRARPKILLATNYEEAIELYNRYKDYLLCLISDVRFPKKGTLEVDAGIQLIQHVKSQITNLPTVLQSSDPENAAMAHTLKSTFINKNSESLLQDLKSFINYYLGFGHFVYRDKQGRQIAIAKSMKEFESYLRTVPEESLVYHGVKNHFSLWLMARGEIQIAKIINPLKITDFESPEELRKFLIDIMQRYRNERDKGKIVAFEEDALLQESNIVSMASGSLGGKGRGLAFINTLIYNFKFPNITPFINLRTPKTCIIGTDEFDIFLDKNHLHEIIFDGTDYESIRKAFLKGKLSYELEKKLKVYIKLISSPIAVRSSSLFEDSRMHPFSGIFETYLLPNDHIDFNERLRQLMDAIKLVFASIYSDNARTYFKAVHYKIEEEKMAVVLQEVVGNRYEKYYYPHISGTAQSHNYYPVAHMKPEEGFALMALGLGQYVVEGEKAYRFSPSYPKLDITTPKDLYKNSQVHFYAVKMGEGKLNFLKGEDVGLIKLDISEAEKHGTSKHLASVYNAENDIFVPGIDTYGPRIINFANILKYDYIPLAETLNIILDVVKEALGSPVEIEYAVDLNKTENNLPSFYLLQIKPLVGSKADYTIDMKKINPDNIILHAEKSMGNGRIQHLHDIIYVDLEKFNKTDTLAMTYEIEKLNARMLKENKQYVLMGPGRWGTRDKFIGIPVAWPQISNAKVIVEISMDDFPLDASLGSHFFHNVTSMNVGYFSVNHTNPDDFIRWELLKEQTVIEQTKYFKHIRFENPLAIYMDGKKRISLITI